METKGIYNVNWGGVRKAGKGKTLGKPVKLKNGRNATIYLDEDTEKALLKINPKISKAIRILAGTDKV
jgi:hypothetical protein